MNALLIQAGAGVYARLQGGVDGAVTLEYGQVAGGCFYAASPAQRIYAPCWDGCGWHLAAVEALVEAFRPAQTRSQALEVDLALAQRRMFAEMQKTLQMPQKAGEDWVRIARLLRALAQAGRLPAATLSRFAADRWLPPLVRAAALGSLAGV